MNIKELLLISREGLEQIELEIDPHQLIMKLKIYKIKKIISIQHLNLVKNFNQN